MAIFHSYVKFPEVNPSPILRVGRNSHGKTHGKSLRLRRALPWNPWNHGIAEPFEAINV